MALDLENVQKTLVSEGLDGWLLYDFHGSNPIAVNIAGLAGKHMTRRWYYFIPCKGAPRKLVHELSELLANAKPTAAAAWQEDHWIASGAINFTYDYYVRGHYDRLVKLEAEKSPLLKPPFARVSGLRDEKHSWARLGPNAVPGQSR